MMNPEVKVKWLEALRSNQYKQGRMCLQNAFNKFCCLGVLCKIMDEPISVGSQSYPEVVFCEKINLSRRSAETLAEQNDSGKSFEQIADIIEKDL